MMKALANLLFEARILKEIPRSGYHFLGSGRESVAEHTFLTTFVGFVLAHIHPDVDRPRLLEMCLIHDLAEARTGDLNYVQKKYVVADENRAIQDLSTRVPFGSSITRLFAEYTACETIEAKLAHDADQLALILELKALVDAGYNGPADWVPHVFKRFHIDSSRKLGEQIWRTPSDGWWFHEKYDGRDA
jgi:putative hydrolases of HD superfamily